MALTAETDASNKHIPMKNIGRPMGKIKRHPLGEILAFASYYNLFIN